MFRPLSVFNRNRTSAMREGDAGYPLFQFHREIDRLFDDFFSDFGAPAYFTGDRNNNARPVHVEFKDKGKSIDLEAELPGVDEDDIDVELKDNLLTIKGEKKFEEEDEKEGYSKHSYSSFQRSMSLPFDVDPDAVEATFKNGVLKLSMPKPPELAARTRKIDIRRG